MTPEPVTRSPFAVLWRAFVTQFFADESATTEMKVRQAAIWVFAFLLVPGVFLLAAMFPTFENAAIRVKYHRAPEGLVQDLIMWIAFLLTTYSMASTGFIAVLAWDSLTFDRRDAMVLGPLPLKPATILSAKLAALGAFLLAGSLPINTLNALVFALETSNHTGVVIAVRHFTALLLTTIVGSILVFSAIVFARAAIALAGGPRLASACGPPLKFLFAVGLLCLSVFSPFVLKISFESATFTNWMPSAWCVGLFERLRGSPRALDPAFPFIMLARRAIVITAIAVAGALIASVVEFRRHMRQAAAPVSVPGLLGGAHVSRAIAHLIVDPRGRDAVARATSDFILLTLARNREQQGLIAVNAALVTALAIAGMSHRTRDLADLMHPRTAVLWVPLLMAYGMTIGVRAAAFVPSEVRAAWAFRHNGPEPTPAYWSAARASILAFVLPRTLVVVALLVPLIGWRVAAWHALIVSALVTLLVEIIALTIDFIPFTRAHEPGHARLKTRWYLYVFGLFAFAYWPVRIELAMLGSPDLVMKMAAVLAGMVAALEVFGRRQSRRWLLQAREELDDSDRIAVLNISGVMRPADAAR
jgi:hypothetical protein